MAENPKVFIVILLILSVIAVFLFVPGKSDYYGVLSIDLDEIVADVDYNRQVSRMKWKEIRKIKSKAVNATKKLLKVGESTTHEEYYKMIIPEANCPKMIRVGEKDDGGKYVCNPEKALNNCTMMSLGLNNQILYDTEIQRITENRCRIIGADRGPQNEQTQKKYGEIRGTLFVATIPETMTIADMVRKHGSHEIEMLKIDIESGEHTALEPFLKEYFVCQIFIEIHGKPEKHLEMMKKIAKQGFRLFSLEPNPYCRECCEYSYINELCMHQYSVTPMTNIIPLP